MTLQTTQNVVLLLGGVRAGKSARAVEMAEACAAERGVLFVATAQAFDDEMAQRIARHRRERPAHWQTLEVPLDVPGEISAELARNTSVGVIIIDCLTLWVSNLLLADSDDEDPERIVVGHVERLLREIRSAGVKPGGPLWIIVSNEVGLGVVPPTALGRAYRDALGRANQMVAANANDVRLMVAGIELPIKSRG